MMIPCMMTSPCDACERKILCGDICKCRQFREAFVPAWDAAVGFLKEQIQ